MKRKEITCLLSVCMAGTTAFAQAPPKELPLISVGAGLTLFSGDVGSMNHTGGAFRSAYRFTVEQRFGNWIGAGIFADYGTLSKSERSLTLNRNFESPLLFVGANAILYSDNDVLFNRGSAFSPYLTAGFGWMSFDPHGDLKDANNKTYYYWSNGSIHDLPENDPNAALSSLLHRDYTYETKLTDSTTNYQRSSFAVPLGAGLRFRFGEHAGANIQASYFLSFTDYIDNVKDGGNDSWWWFGCSVYYKFGKADKSKDDGDAINAMMHDDYDGDGVADIDDECQGTPKGVKVDSKGCPIDSDNDGVPDYRDKEPDTPAGKTVDADGVTIDFSKIEQEAQHDSLNASQKEQFNTNPSLETLKQGDSDAKAKQNGADCIPEEFRAADANKDCVITADEINAIINGFFDGAGAGSDWTADRINRLIDYFFDQ